MFQESSQTSDYSTGVFADCTEVVDSSFKFAFQPLIDIATGETVGHEALVRGHSGESAATVLEAIRPENRYFFDQACRMRALKVADSKGIDTPLHLNCSHISPDNLTLSIDATVEAAQEFGIAPSRIVLEFGNLEILGNPRQLNKAREMAHAAGLKVLSDNIGAGEVGLKRLAVFRPDFAKLDRSLIQGIDSSARKQAIVLGLIATCKALEIQVIATGVEQESELEWLKDAGISVAQGFYFAHPTFNPADERKAA